MGVEGETESEREGEKRDRGGGGGGKRKVGRALEEQEKDRQRWEEGERKRVGNRNYGLGIVDAFLVQSKGKNKTYFPSLSSAKRPLKRWLWSVSHQAGN